VIVFQDMTRLREAEQLKDDFLSLVSHEFRTPLTAIHGGARLLGSQRDQLDDRTKDELLADIVLESARLDQMLANMLQLAEVMAGRLTPSTEPVLVTPLIRRVVQEMKVRLPDTEWSIEIPPGLPPVEGDPSLLQQVLRNLYENAIKYTTGHAFIRTTAEVDEHGVEIHIIDNGIGIAAEHVPFVFERFRRPGADPAVRGMGLGLYLCHNLMTAQGGRIRVESHGIGMGTTFSIALPIASGWDADE
ncbi:MAG TPA: ATP-binding protein, partial [Thermomicrobiales bacterium]|nr:ATP-binding protein [Thermomicrobiales bacterium]